MGDANAERGTENDPLVTVSVILRRSQVDLLRKVAGSRRLLRSGGNQGSVSEVVREIVAESTLALSREITAAHATFTQDTK